MMNQTNETQLKDNIYKTDGLSCKPTCRGRVLMEDLTLVCVEKLMESLEHRLLAKAKDATHGRDTRSSKTRIEKTWLKGSRKKKKRLTSFEALGEEHDRTYSRVVPEHHARTQF